MKICKWSICLALCLLLSACSPLPLVEPPANSSIISAAVQFDGEQIKTAAVTAADAKDPALQYTYRMQAKVSACTKSRTETIQKGVLTYGQYTKAMDILMQEISQWRQAFSKVQDPLYEIRYERVDKMTAFILRAQNPGEPIKLGQLSGAESGVFMGYYIYSMKTGTLQKGETTIDHDLEAPIVLLQIAQTYIQAVDGGSGNRLQKEAVYIFIEE